MHLESDVKWKFEYLYAVKFAKDFVRDYGDIVENSWGGIILLV